MTLGARWHAFWFAPTPPGPLGLSRAVFFGGLWALNATQDFREYAAVDPQLWRPVFLLQLLHLPHGPAAVLGLVQALWKAALVLSSLGLFTRLSTAVAFVLGVYLLGLRQSFGYASHSDNAVVLVLLIMALSRAGDAWSLDAVWRRGTRGGSRAPAKATGEYRWPIRMVWVVLTLVFLSAGLAKVGRAGLAWALSNHLALTLVLRNYSSVLSPLTDWGLSVARHEWLARSLATLTLGLELAYPLALISRPARRILVPGMFLAVVGFRILLGPVFYSLMVCHVFWVDWSRVGRWFVRSGCPLRSRAPAPGSPP